MVKQKQEEKRKETKKYTQINIETLYVVGGLFLAAIVICIIAICNLQIEMDAMSIELNNSGISYDNMERVCVDSKEDKDYELVASEASILKEYCQDKVCIVFEAICHYGIMSAWCEAVYDSDCMAQCKIDNMNKFYSQYMYETTTTNCTRVQYRFFEDVNYEISRGGREIPLSNETRSRLGDEQI